MPPQAPSLLCLFTLQHGFFDSLPWLSQRESQARSKASRILPPAGVLGQANRTASIEAVRRDCRKSGFAAFSRKLRCVLRLGCPLIADNSTLTPRKVFSATHMSRQKTYHTAFASAGAKLCEAFFDKLNRTASIEAVRRVWQYIIWYAVFPLRSLPLRRSC